MQSDHVPCSVWKRDNQFWVIPQHTYAGFALHRHTWERVNTPVPANMFREEFAQVNAIRCEYTESLYVLRKFYEKHKVNVSLVVG